MTDTDVRILAVTAANHPDPLCRQLAAQNLMADNMRLRRELEAARRGSLRLVRDDEAVQDENERKK